MIFRLISIQEQFMKLPLKIRKIMNKYPNYMRSEYYKYLFLVSRYFANYENNDKIKKLEITNFLSKILYLMDISRKNGALCNIFTLNYDRIIYQTLLEEKKKYKHLLCDGFDHNKFDYKNLNNCKYVFTVKAGWYIHLHGSPLYYTDKENIYKSSDTTSWGAYTPIPRDDKENRCHIILCAPHQKYDLITHSELLRVYFKCFEITVKESNHIILIGYGGEDDHINEVINNPKPNSQPNIYIIEYKKNNEDRKQFWKNKFDNFDEKHYRSFDNILSKESSNYIEEILSPLTKDPT